MKLSNAWRPVARPAGRCANRSKPLRSMDLPDETVRCVRRSDCSSPNAQAET